VAGPTSVPAPPGLDVVRVRSAAEMHRAVLDRAAASDVVVMAAAVADYAPAARAPEKVAKGAESITIVLERTRDILADLGARRLAGGHGPVLVGFAAETHDAAARGRTKRESKRVDLMVANDVSRAGAGFDADTNAVTIIGEQETVELPLLPKTRVAAEILDRVEAILAARPV